MRPPHILDEQGTRLLLSEYQLARDGDKNESTKKKLFARLTALKTPPHQQSP